MTARTINQLCSEVLRLRPGVFRAVDRTGREYLLHRTASQQLGTLTDLQRNTLRQLAESEWADEAMRAAAQRHDPALGPDELEGLLEQLRAGGWLNVTVVRDGRRAYTIEPYRRPTRPAAHPEDRRADLVLSRFAVFRRSGNDLLIESARSWCAIRVHDPEVAAAVVSFMAPQGDPAGTSLPAPLAGRIWSDLAWATMLVETPGDEETEFDLRQWSPHELWFHQKSRHEGVSDRGFGGTKWASGQFEPFPARRPSSAADVVDLVRPDLESLRGTDATLTQVLEERRSVRRHDDQHPVTLEQIAEFLYRATGVRRRFAGEGVELVTGPNPSGGALDALEFYLAVRLASRLQPGLYRYDRFDHRLEQVSGLTAPVRRLIDAAQHATGGSQDSVPTYPPQVVVLVSARFGRVGWSYETLTYSLILKQVGVAFQTMYCVATAMGLAPCALGAGDLAAFADATGLDPLSEGTVGEFIVGSRPAASPDGPDELAAM